MPDTQLGQALLDVPMDQIVERMGRAIARAQRSLDDMSIQTAIELGITTIDLHETGGAIVTRSLLELGFLPTFYQFTETTIEVSVSLSIRTGEDVHVGGTLSFSTASTSGTGAASGVAATGAARAATGAARAPTGPAGPASPTTAGSTVPTSAAQLLSGAPLGGSSTMFGVTLSADYTRRYEFDSAAASKVTTKMLAVPAPPAFLQALRTNFGIGAGP